MKKANLLTKRRISYLFMAAVLMLCCLLFVSDSINFPSNKYKKSDKLYTPMQYEIATYTNPTDSTVYTEMSDIYTINDKEVSEVNSNQVFTGQTLLIATAQDLYAFSYLANIDDSYLSYNYQLSANIDYSNYNDEFIPIAWKDGKSFSGTFNGDGFEIKGLKLVKLSNDGSDNSALIADEAPINVELLETDYFAMFSKNSGTIENVGLINTEIMINITNNENNVDILGVAPLCGLNSGTIENVYAIDLGVATDESGITAAGGYLISGLVAENTSVFKNAYTAYSIVSNFTVTDYISFHELLNANSGETENLYYYNASIDEYTLKGTETIKYDQGLIGKTFERTPISNSTYCDSLDTLSNKLYSITNSIWYTKESYEDEVTKAAIGLNTPILRGLEETSAKCFNINSTKDFLYMFELFNQSSIFASNAYTYTITNDIDLSALPDYTYSYNSYINASIVGKYDSSRTALVDVKNIASAYPTIYGASISNTVLTEGVECFGLFPYLTGTIKDLNLYYLDEKLTSFEAMPLDVNIRSIGLVSGMVEGGIIDNVNVYGNINLNSNFGRHYIGGIAGILTERGTISNCTTAGKIDAGNNHSVYSNTQVTGYINGNSIGGVVGYATSTNGDLIDSMSAMNLTLASYSSSNTLNQAIGGVLGSGYTSNCEGLANKGNISIGQVSTNYGSVFAAGIIGRHVGLSKQIENFYNQGDITATSNSSNNYISGITNVDILSRAVDGLSVSTLKNSNGKLIYWASSFTNAANIDITGANDVNTSGMVYINSNNTNNNFASEVSGFYNIAYRYELLNDTYSNKEELSATNIDFSSISKYASCIVSTGSSDNNIITAENIYNLKDISFTTSENITNTNMNYSGVILGKYIDLTNINNEGNMLFKVTNATSNNDARTITINGVFEEVSLGCNAYNIFNGGDIDFYIGDSSHSSLAVYADLNISGICYANRNVISNDEYNPLSDTYSSSNVGSINNVINNGNIQSNSYGLGRLISEDSFDGVSSNGTTVNGNTTLKGNCKIAGICNINSGIISNTFNLGDLTSVAYLDGGYSLETAGISCLNTGEYSQIRDCANNGTIRTINMSSQETKNYVISSGITCRNDIDENSTSYTAANQHQRQLVAFTINYGSIYAFNYCDYVTSLQTEPTCKSAGILGMGLCNVLNIVNYGNVLSSEAASGVFCYVQFYKFANNVTSANKVTIANSINYGSIKSIKRAWTEGGNPIPVVYKEVAQVSVNSGEKYIGLGYASSGQFNGAVISGISYASSAGGTEAHANATNINVRYLINFYDEVKAINTEIAVPTNVTNTNDTMFTTKKNDSFMGNPIVYAPLSSISDEDGNIGVFSTDFLFRKAIEGRIELTEETDKYLSDFFEFIAFAKVNNTILETIGWQQIAYANAAENFARDLNAVGNLVDLYATKDSSGYETIVNEAVNNDTWISYCDQNVLNEIVESLLSAQSLDELREIVSYLFFESNNKDTITIAMRQSVVEALLKESNYSKDQLVNILDELLYDELICNIICENDSDFAAIQNLIKDKLNILSEDQIIEVFENYFALLNDGTTVYDIIFNESDSLDYTSSTINLLNTLLNGIDSNIIDDIFKELEEVAANNGTTITFSNTAQLTFAINQLTTDEKINIYQAIINQDYNSYSTSNVIEVIQASLNKYELDRYTTANNTNTINSFVNQLTAANLGTISNAGRDYDYSSNGYTEVDSTSTISSLNRTVTNIDYSSLWNKIKNNQLIYNYLDNYLQTVTSVDNINHKGIYAIATEFTNSYQSNNSPSGLYGRTRTTSDNGILNHRFIYTPDDICGDGTAHGLTYYYGPYTNASYSLWNGGNYNGGASEQYFELFNNEGSDTTQRYVPIFISLDEEYITELVSTTPNKNVYSFVWNGAGTNVTNGDGNCQWVSTDILDQKPEDNKSLLYKNSNYADTLYYNYDNCETTTSTQERQTTTYIKGNGTPLMVQNVNSKLSELPYYLVGYCSASIITGVYYQQDQWETFGAFLTSKSSQGKGVVTTQFIDYTIEDLIKLDGYFTKGRSTGSESLDEKQLINVLMQEILSTNEGKSAVMTALGAELKKNVDVNSFDLAQMYYSALASETSTTNIVNDVLLDMAYNTNAHNLVINNNRDNLLSLIDEDSIANFSSLQKILYSACNNEEYFKAVIAYLTNDLSGYYGYNISSSWYTWLNNEYNSDELEYIYDKVVYLQEKGYTDEQISAILNGTDVAQLEAYINSTPVLDNISISNSTVIGDFTLSSGWTTSLQYEEFNSIFNDKTVEYNSYIINNNGGNIATEIAKESTFTVIASGNGSITIGDNALNINSNNLTALEFVNVPAGNVNINISSNVKIFDIYAVSSIASAIDTLDNNGFVNYNNYTDDTDTYWTLEDNVLIGNTNAASTANLNSTITVSADSIIKITALGTSIQIKNNTDEIIYNIELTNSLQDYYIKGLSSQSYTFDFADYVEISNISIYDIEASFDTTMLSSIIARDNVQYLLGYANFSADTLANVLNLEELEKLSNLKNTIIDFSDASIGTITNTVAKDNYSFNVTNTYPIVVENTNTTIAGRNFGKQVTLKSGGALVYGNIEFSINKNSTIYVYAKSMESINRELTITANSNNYYAEASTAGNVIILKLDGITGQTSVKLYSELGDISIYEIFITNDTEILQASDYSQYYELLNSLDIIDVFDTYSNFVEAYNRSLIFAGTTRVKNYYLTNNSSNSKLTLVFDVNSANSNLSINATGHGYATLSNSSGEIAKVDLDDFNYSGIINFNNLAIGSYEITFDQKVNITAWSLNQVNEVIDSSLFTSNIMTMFNYDVRSNNTYINDLIEIISLLYSGKYRSNAGSYVEGNGLLIWNKLNSTDIMDLIKLIASKDNTALENFINSCENSSVLREVISYLCSNNSKFLSDVMNKANLANLTEEQKKLFASAFVGTDFIINIEEESLQDSMVFDLLDVLNGTNVSNYTVHQFISDGGIIDEAKFIDTMHALDFNLSTEGYGIYALSSSKGILNGNFIPDNIALNNIDSCYEYSGNHWVLTNEESASWRGGTVSNKNDTSNNASVNHAVYVEMKQLKESISTTIFTLDLIAGDYTMYSSEELIDLTNKTITYYVPTTINLNNVYIDIETIDIAYNATMYLKNSTDLSQSFGLSFGDNTGIIKVVAEDVTVVSEYTIIIKELNVEYINLELDTLKSNEEAISDPNITADFGMPYINGYISLILTSNKLPKGLDIEPYLTITDSNNKAVSNYELDTEPYIDEFGSTVINIMLLDTMIHGKYTITVSVFGKSAVLTFYKNPSTKNDITSFIYDGNPIEFINNSATTYIPFGRCYNYDELVSTSYLSEIKVSPGASYTVEAEYNDINDIITYIVTYTVTAENGSYQVYTHYLIENNPLIEGNIANIYKNGSAVLNSILDDNTISLSFRRGEVAPSYKVKYNLTNFYLEGDYSYIINQDLDYTGTACDAKYSGLTIEISDSADAGVYEYNYVYTNTGIWDNSIEYTKEYIFPLITVNKNYAIDAQLKRLTFLDTQIMVGAAYTVMYPQYSIRPGDTTSTNEVKYNSLKNGATESPIKVEAKNIIYNDNSSDNSNFYAVGTLSNAELANYAPTFGIYEYSEIYQYTTLTKLTQYGRQTSGDQTKVDYEVVNTDYTDDLFVYVPYNGSDKSTKIFLIKIVDGLWTDVYETTYAGSGDPIASVSENKGGFSYNGVEYTISEYAGTISSDNKSLYMDYIGTPLDDHFWWVSYVIFSEDYMRNPSADNQNLKFYHVSLIDISNTIYFNFTFETPADLQMSSIYLSILDRVYSEDENKETVITPVNIHAFASENNGVYSLEYNLQVLPRGYFYFYLNLPEGYVCEYEIINDRSNTNDGTIEEGAYLPPASIVTQKVDIKIIIKEQTGYDSNQTIIWAESTSEVFSIQATERIE